MTDSKKFYLTTPIYYANSRPHVGSAYTTIVCDVIARYKRMCGYEVAYLTGTDEHGVNIERAAEAQGVTPQQLVDKNQQIFRDLWKLLGIQYTDFVRTTSPEHARAVQTLVRRTLKRSPDAIYKKKYEGRYCIYDNLYVSDTPEPANCQICGRPAELISEENYFFRLSAYQQKLLDFYAANPQWVQPDFRFNEVKSFVEAGLKDVSISRKTIKWGIPWPDDPDHVFYVWYDALTSYMSGIGYGEGDLSLSGGRSFSSDISAANKERASAPEGVAAIPEGNAQFNKFWPADVHMIGKEIIRFHAVYWPAFLMAAELPLPKKVFAHGWLLFEQEKMSKSKGNVAYPEPIVKVLGNDALRYYLLRETVFGQDGNFSREALITRYNADLANGLGNLASRTLTMIEQYCSSEIPNSHIPDSGPVLQGTHDRVGLGQTLKEEFEDRSSTVMGALERSDFSESLVEIWALISLADQFLTLCKPWLMAKDTEQRELLGYVLYCAAECVRIVTVLAHAAIPSATERIWEQLGQPGKLADVRIDQLKWGDLKPGTKIGKPEAVFPRVDKKEAMEKIEAMESEIKNPGAPAPAPRANETDSAIEPGPAKAAAASAAAAAGQQSGGLATSHSLLATDSKIAIDDLMKIDLRVGVIKSAERIPNADKLLKLQVDIGEEVRQILAGIALAYSPEELVGRKIVVVANLAPRKMRGLESNGMLLAASVADGKPVLCTFGEDIVPGARIK
ncbi:MAG TPA: methionine--tRNA ligase subunit beta [Candidatus Acidoferrales bacterium]|nr:methionine--tRNA ligase subunit beta [Candidatus Acidoferrales bacterium]